MKRICLGKIIGTHGVKGLVKILPFGEDPQRLQEYSPLYTGEASNGTLSIALKNPHGKTWLAEIDGIQNREEAQALNGTELWTDRKNLPDIEAGDEFYISDLIGLNVVDEKNQKIGTVKDVPNFGAGDLIEVQKLSGDDFLIPFQDPFVPEVDIENGFIRIQNFEMI